MLVPTLLIHVDLKDKENGGISDRPDNAVDIYHTYFGIAGAAFLPMEWYLYQKNLYVAGKWIRIMNSSHSLASRAFINGVPWGEAFGSCLCTAIGCCQSDFLEKIEHSIYAEICSDAVECGRYFTES